jgi:hypothetical protein
MLDAADAVVVPFVRSFVRSSLLRVSSVDLSIIAYR